MIKIFRNIRKTLLAEGNTVKYLKYAIGEIILVVIGILIAVQINHWYTSVNQAKQEQFYLKKLVQNISEDTEYLQERIQEMDSAAILLKQLKTEIESPAYKEFTFNSAVVVKLISIYRFSPQKSTMDNLISTGKLDLIRNQAVVDSLFVYYNDLNNYPAQRNTSDETYSRETFGPKLLQMPGGIFHLKKSMLSSADSLFISNVLQMKFLSMEGLQRDYRFSFERANRIITLLNAEIK